MKKLNMLLMFTMMIAAGLLSSCQKDEAVNEVNKVTGDLKVIDFNCDECVEAWTDTQVTYDASYFTAQSTSVPALENVYVDVWNDETTVYYRVYRLNGATFNHLAVGMNNNLTVVNAYGVNSPITEYSWTTSLTEGWAACDEVGCIAIIIGQLSKPGGGINHAHYNFCQTYLLRDICEEVECTTETAWAAGPRYTPKGNWATYTPYVAGSTVNIYAGQNMLIGTATFSAVVNGEVTIQIALVDGWEFEPVMESLKIQHYMNPPSGNPSPGQFAWKWDATGSTWTAVVPAANYYGIHLDVQLCE